MKNRILVVSLFQFILVYRMFDVCNAKIESSSVGEFPSAVAIVNTKNRALSCSGAIVSKNMIVCSRLCKKLNSKLEDLAAIIEKNALQDKNVKEDQVKKILHVECSNDESDDVCFFENALCLLVSRLNDAGCNILSDFTLGATYLQTLVEGEFEEKSIATVEKTHPKKGDSVHLVGWRIAALDKRANNILKQEFTVTQCREKTTASEFCADPGSELPNKCPGDVGGPIYKGNKLQGIFLSGFCRSPGEYIRATDLLHIHKSLRRISAKKSSAQNLADGTLTRFALLFACVYVLKCFPPGKFE